MLTVTIRNTLTGETIIRECERVETGEDAHQGYSSMKKSLALVNDDVRERIIPPADVHYDVFVANCHGKTVARYSL